MNGLVLQSYGGEIQYRRAVLLLLSFWSVTKNRTSDFKTMVYTDNIPFFRKYIPWMDIDYVSWDMEKIVRETNHFKFVHRMKISILEDSFKRVNGNLLYSDTDSFFLKNPLNLLGDLTADTSFMHKREYGFSDLKTIPLPSGEESRRFYNSILPGKFELQDGTKILLTDHLSSWNAGIMIFHKSQASLLPDVFRLTDWFFELSSNHASEQFAFSAILQTKTNLKSCEDYSYHYWYAPCKKIVDEFLVINLPGEANCKDESWYRDWIKHWISRLPAYVENHVIFLKDSAIQAFNRAEFRKGYQYAFKALIRSPLDIKFIKDILYHSKRKFSRK